MLIILGPIEIIQVDLVQFIPVVGERDVWDIYVEFVLDLSGVEGGLKVEQTLGGQVDYRFEGD